MIQAVGNLFLDGTRRAVSRLGRHIMGFQVLALAAVLALAPAGVFAHGQAPAPAHGGRVQDVHGHWVELVVHANAVSVFVSDEHGQPTPAGQASGFATVLVDGQPVKVQLAPAAANELAGKLPAPAPSGAAATVSLRIDGKTATARFPTRE